MSRRSSNQEPSLKSEKMQRYYAERETTGPEFGKIVFFLACDFGTRWKSASARQRAANRRINPQSRTIVLGRVFCA